MIDREEREECDWELDRRLERDREHEPCRARRRAVAFLRPEIASARAASPSRPEPVCVDARKKRTVGNSRVLDGKNPPRSRVGSSAPHAILGREARG